MELYLWRNLQLVIDPETYMQHFYFSQLNLNFDNNSVFHFYAERSNIIEIILKRFHKMKEEGLFIEPADKTLPLQILNVDDNGHSAIALAVNSQSFKSLDQMI